MLMVHRQSIHSDDFLRDSIEMEQLPEGRPIHTIECLFVVNKIYIQ